jgi:hypothetical protein
MSERERQRERERERQRITVGVEKEGWWTCFGHGQVGDTLG